MKKGIITFGIIFIVALISYLIYREGTLPVNKNSKESKIFVIKPGEDIDTIINNLWKEGLVRNKLVFFAIIKKQGIEKKIQAGDFRLSPSMDAYKLADELTHGTLDVWITIIEGLRKEEIAEIVSKKFQVSDAEFTSLAQEGYLFPDTYLLPTQSTAETIIDTLTRTFNEKYNDEMKQRARRLGLTDAQVITLASIVEREASANDAETVADILYRRLQDGIPLQADATVQYALGYQVNEKSWWKKNLTYDDLKIDSPYNTYKNLGLPPGPIASPGLTSIEAVITANPNTPYLFYIHDPSGQIHYAKNVDEHEKNIEKYLR